MQSAKALQAQKIATSTDIKSRLVKVPELYDIERGDDAIPTSLLEALLFEQISGQELIMISRTDILNGQSVVYQPISNLRDVALQYSYSNIISLPGTLSEIFRQYGIVLENYVPDVDPQNLEDKSPWLNAYIDDQIVDDGSVGGGTIKVLVLELQNMQENFSVFLEVMESGISKTTSHGLSWYNGES